MQVNVYTYKAFDVKLHGTTSSDIANDLAQRINQEAIGGWRVVSIVSANSGVMGNMYYTGGGGTTDFFVVMERAGQQLLQGLPKLS